MGDVVANLSSDPRALSSHYALCKAVRRAATAPHAATPMYSDVVKKLEVHLRVGKGMQLRVYAPSLLTEPDIATLT